MKTIISLLILLTAASAAKCQTLYRFLKYTKYQIIFHSVDGQKDTSIDSRNLKIDDVISLKGHIFSSAYSITVQIIENGIGHFIARRGLNPYYADIEDVAIEKEIGVWSAAYAAYNIPRSHYCKNSSDGSYLIPKVQEPFSYKNDRVNSNDAFSNYLISKTDDRGDGGSGDITNSKTQLKSVQVEPSRDDAYINLLLRRIGSLETDSAITHNADIVLVQQHNEDTKRLSLISNIYNYVSLLFQFLTLLGIGKWIQAQYLNGQTDFERV